MMPVNLLVARESTIEKKLPNSPSKDLYKYWIESESDIASRIGFSVHPSESDVTFALAFAPIQMKL